MAALLTRMSTDRRPGGPHPPPRTAPGRRADQPGPPTDRGSDRPRSPVARRRCGRPEPRERRPRPGLAPQPRQFPGRHRSPGPCARREGWLSPGQRTVDGPGSADRPGGGLDTVRPAGACSRTNANEQFRQRPSYGEVVGVDVKAEASPGGSRQTLKHLVRYLYHGSATLAHQMAMGESSQVIGGRPMTEMGMDHNAESFQLVEVAVDGGQIDVRAPGCGPRGNILRGAVAGASKRACSSSRRELVIRHPWARRRSAPLRPFRPWRSARRSWSPCSWLGTRAVAPSARQPAEPGPVLPAGISCNQARR